MSNGPETRCIDGVQESCGVMSRDRREMMQESKTRKTYTRKDKRNGELVQYRFGCKKSTWLKIRILARLHNTRYARGKTLSYSEIVRLLLEAHVDHLQKLHAPSREEIRTCIQSTLPASAMIMDDGSERMKGCVYMNRDVLHFIETMVSEHRGSHPGEARLTVSEMISTILDMHIDTVLMLREPSRAGLLRYVEKIRAFQRS